MTNIERDTRQWRSRAPQRLTLRLHIRQIRGWRLTLTSWKANSGIIHSRRIQMSTIFQVNDMRCGHRASTITKAIGLLD